MPLPVSADRFIHLMQVTGEGVERARPGSVVTVMAAGVGLLRPEEQVWEAMLRGFGVQQRARFLAESTISAREGWLRRFASWTNAHPWQWRGVDVEEWTSAAISERRMTHATVRVGHVTLRLFMEFVSTSGYGWPAECETRFGSFPTQICHEGNTVVHVAQFEGRPGNRPLTRDELQRFFDAADERVAAARRRGRKGWLPAFRDATLFKVAYGWGLRRREVARLESCDWTRNPKATEFGGHGSLSVRWAKALPGGPPRRRTVLSVFGWAVEVVAQYLAEVRPRYVVEGQQWMWPTERGGRLADANLGKTFAALRVEAGLPAELGPHCLRHSYVTHLVEDGWDPLFVQHQVGHAWASTTAIYTGVSSDFKNRSLRAALDAKLGERG